MRDPVARLWSGIDHRLGTRITEGTTSPEVAAARFTAALEDNENPDLARSDYGRTIAALEAAVPESRRLYLFHETLFSQAAYDRVTDFLGVARGRARPGREVNRSRAIDVRPDAAALARARERLAPVYDFVREPVRPRGSGDLDAVTVRAQRTRGVRWTATATTF